MVIKTAEKYMREVAVELRINPIGQLIPFKMYIDMLSGDFTPNWNVNELLKNDYHQGVTVLRFAQFKPDEISNYKSSSEPKKTQNRLESMTRPRCSYARNQGHHQIHTKL